MVFGVKAGKVTCCLALTEGSTAKRQVCNSETVLIIPVENCKN